MRGSIPVIVGDKGTRMDGVIITGADVTVLSREFLERHPELLEELQQRQEEGKGEAKLGVVGGKVVADKMYQTTITVQADPRDQAEVPLYVAVLPDGVDLILGLDWQCQCGAITNTWNNTIQLWHTTVTCQLQMQWLRVTHAKCTRGRMTTR